MGRKRGLAILLAAIFFAIVAGFALAPKVSPSRALAPSIFVSFDEEGCESRIIFSIDAESDETAVTVYDDDNWGKPGKRWLSECPFEHDPAERIVRFDGRMWRLSGETGNRRLENTESETGALWGTYYENEDEARTAEPYRYEETWNGLF